MFSDKTSTLLSIAFKQAMLGFRVLYINHLSDNRSDARYSTHNPALKDHMDRGSKVEFISSGCLTFLRDNYQDYDVVCIDEGRFFADLFIMCKELADLHGKEIHVAGLSGDSRRQRFGQLLDLIPIADSVVHTTAMCRRCPKEDKRKAIFTHRTKGGDAVIEIGGKDKYEALCRKCYMSAS